MSLPRETAVDRVEALVDAVGTDPMPVPVREVWVFGDLALGLDPVERLDVYLTKELYLGGTERATADDAADHDRLRESYGVEGVGRTVSAEWAEAYPAYLRANDHGHAAPEQCLAAHLLDAADLTDERVHLEVCNASFEDNVTQRLRGARLREDYTQLLDPRGVCLWAGGVRSETAFEKLRASEFAMPTLSAALEMLGMDETEATEAAKAVHAWRTEQEGVTVRGDVV